MEFKQGDIVQLKSGSCDMTVSKEARVNGGLVGVAWYDNGMVNQLNLPTIVLEKINSKKG